MSDLIWINLLFDCKHKYVILIAVSFAPYFFFNIGRHITINWETKPDIEAEQPEIYLVSLDQEEVKILDVLTEQYDAIYTKTDFKHFYIRFKTKEAFGKFKKSALELSRSYYVFEGDVERAVRVKREYHGSVELEPLDSFDITNTLAKILGLRNDY